MRRLPVERHSGVDQPFEMEVEPTVRRPRGRRLRDEVSLVDLKPVVPQPTPAIETVVAAEPVLAPVTAIAASVEEARPPVRSAIHLRVDRPKTRRPAPSIMRRWAAEEFSGELDDQVNARWLMNALEGGAIDAGDEHMAEARTDGSTASTNHEARSDARPDGSEKTTARDSGASKAGLLRLFSEESTMIVVEPSGADASWPEIEAPEERELTEQNSRL